MSFEISSGLAAAAQRYIEMLRGEVNEYLDMVSRFDDGCPQRLADAIRYSLLAPGKRMRPLLVLLACELCGGQRQLAMPAACAVEMIHCYSLIHDDLPAMDDDDFRRGLPTCHKQFDEATAILAGDALIASAFEMLGKIAPPELAGRCCRELALAAGPCQLVGGQMEDIISEKHLDGGQPEVTALELLEKIHQRKTGALIRVSLRLGAFVADAVETQLEKLNIFGTDFGLAFQITDDLLDVLGDEETVGKRLNKDAAAGKYSYPVVKGIEESQKEAAFLVNRAVESLIAVGSSDSISFDVLRYMTLSLTGRTQ